MLINHARPYVAIASLILTACCCQPFYPLLTQTYLWECAQPPSPDTVTPCTAMTCRRVAPGSARRHRKPVQDAHTTSPTTTGGIYVYTPCYQRSPTLLIPASLLTSASLLTMASLYPINSSLSCHQ